jgi:hypothetical protein
MYLFELAIELDERSTDLAEAAPELGLEGITPTSELTPEQVAALRAKFVKVPAAPSPNSSSAGSSPYRPVQPSVVPSAPAILTEPTGRSGMGLGQLVLVLLAIAGVLGLVAFMVQKSHADQERRERIAAKEPVDDGVPTTGPDGKPLTEQQQLDVAKLEAAKAQQDEQKCSVLRDIRNADIAMSNATKGAGSLDEIKALMLQASNETIPLYDRAMPVIPEQADNMRKLQQFSRDTLATVQAATDPSDLQRRLLDLSSAARSSGVIAAATQFDAYAQSTCGFSVGNN